MMKLFKFSRTSPASLISSTRLLSSCIIRRGTFEPDYLDSAGPVIPTYPPLNIQIKGNKKPKTNKAVIYSGFTN